MATKTLGLGDIQNLLAGIKVATPEQTLELQKQTIPRLTSTQRDALSASQRPPGTLVYNTTTNKLNLRTASAWEVITSA